jgi:formylglycine-generating enzyme required for sulfatase activity
VTIARPFAAGKFEVTRAEFAVFLQESGRTIGDVCNASEGGVWQNRPGRSFRNPGFVQDDRHPAVCLTWEDATAFVGWLSNKTGKSYRLPTEAEWEYMARAGTTTRYHFGNDERDLCTHDNVGDWTAREESKLAVIANCRDGYGYTAPKGSFQPNSFGLFDVQGNVSEWVQDCWNEGYRGAPSDGSGWTGGDCARRIMRGGSWSHVPNYIRLAHRGRVSPFDRYDYVGFRVVRTLGP